MSQADLVTSSATKDLLTGGDASAVIGGGGESTGGRAPRIPTSPLLLLGEGRGKPAMGATTATAGAALGDFSGAATEGSSAESVAEADVEAESDIATVNPENEQNSASSEPNEGGEA